MAANMWKNSLKNVESDNNKILYEILLDVFFYSETVLTVWISLVHNNVDIVVNFNVNLKLLTKLINSAIVGEWTT